LLVCPMPWCTPRFFIRSIIGSFMLVHHLFE
jgi:hypothetical protein